MNIRLCIFLALSACSGGVSARLEEEQAAAEQRQAEERAALTPTRDAVVAFLSEQLKVPPETLGRLHANLGERCAIVVDPQDPAGCATATEGRPYATCRSMLLVQQANAWALRAAAPGVSYDLPDACPISLLTPWEYRELGSLERVGWAGGM